MHRPFSLWVPGTDPSLRILEALSAAIKVSQANQSYPLTSGTLVSEQPRRYAYQFALLNAGGPPDGANLVLESADFDRPIQVEISELTTATVTLVVNQRLLERTLHQATLLIDNTWFLSHLKDALEQQKAASRIEQVLFGIRASRESIPAHLVDVNPEAILRGVFTPDEHQRLAIERSLRDELLLVIGPPGTGKTDVLAAIVLAHLLRGSAPRILVLSHTNIALDNAIARLIAFCRRAGAQARINARQIIRVGTPRLEELSGPDYRSVVLPLIIEDESISIRLEVKRIEAKQDQLRTKLVANRQQEKHLGRIWRKERDRLNGQIEATGLQLVNLQHRGQIDLTDQHQAVTRYEQQRDTAETHAEQVHQGARLATTQRNQAEQRVLQQNEAVQIWEQRLFEWQQKTPAGRLFANLGAWIRNEDPIDYAQLLAQAQNERDQARSELMTAREGERQWVNARKLAQERRDEATRQHISAKKQLDESEAVYQAQERQLEADRSKLVAQAETGEAELSALRAMIASQAREIGGLDQALALLDRDLVALKSDLSRDLVNHAQVVGATLSGLFLSQHLLNQHWDVVIVDEASMVAVPAVQLAARCAGSHLILIGDPKQLAPVCRFDERTITYWLGQDIYTLGRYTIDEAGRGEHSSVFLPLQSRMHPAICDLIRSPVYHDLLRDRESQPPRLQLAPYPESSVVLYDSSGRSEASQPKKGGSRQNLVHAESMPRLIEEMLSGLRDPKPEALGVVTPYRAQVWLIEERLRQARLERWVRVGTVHAFQGLEFVGLVFDTVDAPGIKLSPFTSGGRGSDAMRLINVAITRARDKLVLVANLEYQLQAPERYILPQVLRIARTKQWVHIDP